MKVFFLIFVFIIAGCTGHHDEGEFDLAVLNSISTELADLEVELGPIEVQWWPKEIAELRPKEIRKTEEGLYIKLRSLFSEESGLYIPAKGVEVDLSDSNDPNYRLLQGNVYSYYIKG